jgi:hypothetical protein
MYNLLYLGKGKFPWFGDNGNRPSAKTEHIALMKESLRAEELFKDLPSKKIIFNINLEEFCLAFEYIKQLDF